MHLCWWRYQDPKCALEVYTEKNIIISQVWVNQAQKISTSIPESQCWLDIWFGEK